MKAFMYFVVISAALLIHTSAEAGVEWIICDTCTTPSAFEGSAIEGVAGRLGIWGFYVGNSKTGEVRRITVNARRSGIDPTSANQIQSDLFHEKEDLSNNKDEVQSPPSPPIIYEIYGDVRQSAGAEIHFMDIVALAIPPGGPHGITPIVLPRNPSFGSFDGRNQDAVRDYAWQNIAAQIYSVRSTSPYDEAALAALSSALAATFGAAQKCFIFNNGDVGCFVLPTTATRAAPYVSGTAKNAAGQAIVSGGGGGGGGSGVSVRQGNGGSYYGPTLYSHTGSLWLFCTIVDGKITDAQIVFIAD